MMIFFKLREYNLDVSSDEDYSGTGVLYGPGPLAPEPFAMPHDIAIKTTIKI